jgi:putative membrane protein
MPSPGPGGKTGYLLREVCPLSGEMDLRLEALSKYIVTSPSWTRSLALILILSGCVEIMAILGTGKSLMHPTLFPVAAYLVPAIAALALTPRLARWFGGKLTYGWSGLTAAIGLVISIFISLSPILLVSSSFPVFLAISLAFVFAFRMLLLAAVVDFHLRRVVVPALLHSGIAVAGAAPFLGLNFVQLSVILHASFAVGVLLFIIVIERPMKANFKVGPLELANAFLAHLSEGSRKLDDFFRSIGESVVVPQVSLVIQREGRDDILVTVPNIHPGPLGEIGGSNLPKILHGMLGNGSMVFHGSASHDFNPVDEVEVRKAGVAVLQSLPHSCSNTGCTASARHRCGSVDVLAQAFGDTVVAIATRSPLVTEDLDYSVGFAIMKSGEKFFSHVAFADAHNCMDAMEDGVYPATSLAMEYIGAAEAAFASTAKFNQGRFSAGYAARTLPYTRAEGFGDLGVQVLVVIVGEQKTAYVLFDGNNMQTGTRDEIRRRLLLRVDECEVLTTDTHVVNTVSGRNQVGLRVPVETFYPFVEEAVIEALSDAAPARTAGVTAWCSGIVIFGSQRISQIASTVNGMMGFLIPVAIIILLGAFLTTAMAYFLLVY